MTSSPVERELHMGAIHSSPPSTHHTVSLLPLSSQQTLPLRAPPVFKLQIGGTPGLVQPIIVSRLTPCPYEISASSPRHTGILNSLGKAGILIYMAPPTYYQYQNIAHSVPADSTMLSSFLLEESWFCPSAESLCNQRRTHAHEARMLWYWFTSPFPSYSRIVGIVGPDLLC
jgi:hypothetical protein